MKKIIYFITGAMIMNINLYSNNLNIPHYGNVEFKPPVVKPLILDNGLKIYIKKDATLPTVRMEVLIKTGTVYDPQEKAGLGSLFFEVLRNGGSKNFSSDEIDKKLEYLGAEITTSISPEEASISMFSHKKDFDEVFNILSDLIKNPAFEEKKFELKKQEAIEMVKRRNDNPDRQATREALRIFFGKNHPYGMRSEIETISKITVDDLKAYRDNFIIPNNMIVSIAGDFDENEMNNKIKKEFGDIQMGDVKLPDIALPQTPDTRTVYLIDKPLKQAFVVILNKGIARHDDREYPLTVLSEYMGGGIQSRLGNEIRSKRGLAYSVYSYFSKRNKAGFIMTYLGTKPESVNEAIEQVFLEMEKVKTDKIDEKEFDMAKSEIINSFVFRFQTQSALLDEIASYDLYGYKPDYLSNYTSRIDAVKIKDMVNSAKEFYDTKNSLIFVIGDSKKFAKPLENFGRVITLQED
jgi:zinc protease